MKYSGYHAAFVQIQQQLKILNDSKPRAAQLNLLHAQLDTVLTHFKQRFVDDERFRQLVKWDTDYRLAFKKGLDTLPACAKKTEMANVFQYVLQNSIEQPPAIDENEPVTALDRLRDEYLGVRFLETHFEMLDQKMYENDLFQLSLRHLAHIQQIAGEEDGMDIIIAFKQTLRKNTHHCLQNHPTDMTLRLAFLEQYLKEPASIDFSQYPDQEHILDDDIIRQLAPQLVQNSNTFQPR